MTNWVPFADDLEDIRPDTESESSVHTIREYGSEESVLYDSSSGISEIGDKRGESDNSEAEISEIGDKRGESDNSEAEFRELANSGTNVLIYSDSDNESGVMPLDEAAPDLTSPSPKVISYI